MGHSSTPHLVVIEHDPPTLRLLERILSGSGYRVTGRSDLDIGSAEVVSLAADALIVDHFFEPDNPGLAVIERLKTDPATAGLPILVASTSAPDAAAQPRLTA